MSELKERMLGQTMNEYGCDTKIYLKSEADKVIAELEADKLELKQRLNVLDGKLFGLSQSYNIKISMYGCLERKIKEKDKVIADLEESHKKEVGQLLMEIAKLNKKIKLNEDLGSCKKGCPALRHSQRRVESEIYKVESNEKEIRHQKYKRCLNNAKSCLYKVWYYKEIPNRNGAKRMWKWYQRLLKIAEQFKEA